MSRRASGRALVIASPARAGDRVVPSSMQGLRRPGSPSVVGQAARARFRERVAPHLAEALGVPVGDLQWSYDDSGGPLLTGLPWHVSVSHAVGLSVLAVHDRPVGIDVETSRRGAAAAARLVARFPEEQRAAVMGSDETIDGSLVTALWVRKEAVAKAARRGLDAGIGELAVPLAAPPVEAWCDGHLGRWFVQDMRHEQFLIAVATADEVVLERITLADES